MSLLSTIVHLSPLMSQKDRLVFASIFHVLMRYSEQERSRLNWEYVFHLTNGKQLLVKYTFGRMIIIEVSTSQNETINRKTAPAA